MYKISFLMVWVGSESRFLNMLGSAIHNVIETNGACMKHMRLLLPKGLITTFQLELDCFKVNLSCEMKLGLTAYWKCLRRNYLIYSKNSARLVGVNLRGSTTANKIYEPMSRSQAKLNRTRKF